MKTSLFVATLAVVGAGAVSAGATFALQPFVGSDTEFNIQNDAIKFTGLGNQLAGELDYSGGGSGGAENAMTANPPTQLIGPMSKMMTSTTCNVAPAKYTHASGIAFGLDAVNVYSAASAGGATTCNGVDQNATSDNQGLGLNYDAAIPDAAGGPANIPFGNWTDMLALLYGGLDKTTHITDCASPKRQALVATWSNLFESHCANGNTTCTTATFASTTQPTGGFKINGQLWHAFRRDDNSGTSDVFATLLGLGNITATNSGTAYLAANVSSAGPAASNKANTGFGASPYCNVINWDTTSANKTVGNECGLGHLKQFVGPGGVAQGSCSAAGSRNGVGCDVVGAASTCADGTSCGAGTAQSSCIDGSACSACACTAIDAIHKRPPYLTWGTVADSSLANPSDGLTNAAAVLPTSYQDNDPIRRPCLGLAGDITDNPGEEVCNRDGTLGLVLPIPPVDFVPAARQFPSPATNSVQGNSLGTSAFNVFSCAMLAGNAGLAPGGCPNGDTTFGGGCIAATVDNSNTLVYAGPNDSQTLGNYTIYDGRIYNLTLTDGAGGYTNFNIPAVSKTFGLAFAGDYGRIHQSTVLWDKTAGSTGLRCEGHRLQRSGRDSPARPPGSGGPCSVAYAGDSAATWCEQNPSLCTSVGGTDAKQDPVRMRIAQIQATKTTIRNGAYFLWRKIYLNSSLGFDNLGSVVTSRRRRTPQCAARARRVPESNTASISNILGLEGFFTFGPTGPNGADTPLCEDFNEQMLCTGVGSKT